MQTQITDKTDTISCILLNLRDCDQLIEMGASIKSIIAFLKIAVDCYGKDIMLAVIADFGTVQHKKFATLIERM